MGEAQRGSRSGGRGSRRRQGRADARAGPQADFLPFSPGHAHKDPDLRNTLRTQGRNQALVRGPMLPNSLPCVRHREGTRIRTAGDTAEPAGEDESTVLPVLWAQCAIRGMIHRARIRQRRHRGARLGATPGCADPANAVAGHPASPAGPTKPHWGRKPPIGVGDLPTPIIRCLPQCLVVYPNASPPRLSTAARLPGHRLAGPAARLPGHHFVALTTHLPGRTHSATLITP